MSRTLLRMYLSVAHPCVRRLESRLKSKSTLNGLLCNSWLDKDVKAC